MSVVQQSPPDLTTCLKMQYFLVGDIRQLLHEPFNEQNRRWLLVILDELLLTLNRQWELESEGGYLEEVLENYPTWEPHVAALAREHAVLRETLEQLREDIAHGQPTPARAQLVHRNLRRWMVALAAHERHERRILQNAMNLEVGTLD